jgi:hypothetical protein
VKSEAERREDRILQHTSRCVFFTGTQHKVCEAGVSYDAVRGLEGRGLACLKWETSKGEQPQCDKRRWTTREEAEADIAAADAAFQRINVCLKAIREKHGKARGLVSSMPCPVGCGGTLRYSIASYNGHVHGQCSTAGCASWMQ